MIYRSRSAMPASSPLPVGYLAKKDCRHTKAPATLFSWYCRQAGALQQNRTVPPGHVRQPATGETVQAGSLSIHLYSIKDVGHEVSEYPMSEYLPEIEQFINDLIFDRKQWMTEIHHKDLIRQSDTSSTPANYYD